MTYTGANTAKALHTWWVRKKRPNEIHMDIKQWRAITENKNKLFEIPAIFDDILSGEVTIRIIQTT